MEKIYDSQLQNALKTCKLFRLGKCSPEDLANAVGGCLKSFSSAENNAIRKFLDIFSDCILEEIYLWGADTKIEVKIADLDYIEKSIRRKNAFYDNLISLGFELFYFALINQNVTPIPLFCTDQLEERYQNYEEPDVNSALEKIKLLEEKKDLIALKTYGLNLIHKENKQYTFIESGSYSYDVQRLATELFIKIDLEYATLDEISEWAKNAQGQYKDSMEPKAKGILMDLEIMGYMKELAKSMEEIRDLAIELSKSGVKEEIEHG